MSLYDEKGDSLKPCYSINEIEVDKSKIDLIVNLSFPTCVKAMRPFLRHAGFCCHFIKDFSKIAKPLTSLLAKDVSFHFSEECHMAFPKLKGALTSASILNHPI